MAFLATMIGSELGGEAAQAALAALTTKAPGVHLAAGTAMILEDPVADVEPSTSQHPDRFTFLCFFSYLALSSLLFSNR